MSPRRRWPGGYIHTQKDGRDLYILERDIGGRRWHISTKCHTLTAAMKQLERFETNPAAYRPGGVEGAPILLDEKLQASFLEWSRSVQKNSATWVGQQKLYLKWWRKHFEGEDLRTLTLTEILDALEGVSSRAHRIAVIKRVYSWLVEVRHVLRPELNPTAPLLVPQSQPEQWVRVKATAKKDFEKVRAGVSAHWRDGLDVLAGTGWHVTELIRFARGGQVEQRGGKFILTCPQTKGGEMLRTEVSKRVGVAAKRLLKRGVLNRANFDLAVKKAAEIAKVDFRAGQMRHTVATWAIGRGANPAAVSAFLGHKSPRTTLKFYATHAVPRKVPTLF